MTRSDDHFEKFAAHSRYKHLILKTYFQAWLPKLALRPGASQVLCYVDACAGRGADEAGNDGSPVIAAEAAADATGQIAALRGSAPRIFVIAIEKDPAHFAELRKNLHRFAPDAEALEGELRNHLPMLEARFGATPTLYFIDPFGLAPLQADVVRDALRGPRNEVLLLFADQVALRHFGAAIATESRAVRQLRERQESPVLNLFPEIVQTELDGLASSADRSQKSLEWTKEKSVEILNAAYGDTGWRAAVEGVPKNQRRARFRELYCDFLRSCDAKYILDIPVCNAAGEHVYTLIHATKSSHGLRTMKEAVASALKNGPLPSDVSARLKESMSADLPALVASLRDQLAGKVVPWAEDRADRKAFCLRHYALEKTSVQAFQLDALKSLLTPFRQPKSRALVYAFPEMP